MVLRPLLTCPPPVLREALTPSSPFLPRLQGPALSPSQNLYQLSQHQSLPILFLLLKSSLPAPICLDCLISSCRSWRKPHGHQARGPLSELSQALQTFRTPNVLRRPLCLPVTLEGPKKTSWVCLLHWKVLRRPPASACYTLRS